MFPLENFIDTHIHTAPDVKPRIQTDIEVAGSAKTEKMQAIVLKSHYEPTSGRARIASEVTGLPVFGGVSLNKTVGGINPHAVKASAELGGKFVWLPTISYSKSHMNWDGIDDVLELVKEREMILATGHLNPDHIFTLIDMAKSNGIWRILVNHPLTGVVNASLDEQREMAKHAYLEHCYVACMEKHDHLDPNVIADSITEIGSKRCIMATDFGQYHNPLPAEGMKMFTEEMIERGISMEDIRTMCIENPQRLLF
jgi:hypothetical protein